MNIRRRIRAAFDRAVPVLEDAPPSRLDTMDNVGRERTTARPVTNPSPVDAGRRRR